MSLIEQPEVDVGVIESYDERMQKVLLYTIETLNILAEKGLLTDGGLRLTDKARDLIEGFEPETEELEEAMFILKKEGLMA